MLSMGVSQHGTESSSRWCYPDSFSDMSMVHPLGTLVLPRFSATYRSVSIGIAATWTYVTGFKAVTFVLQRRDLTKNEEHVCVNALLEHPCREWQLISWDPYLSPNKETITLWLRLITSQMVRGQHSSKPGSHHCCAEMMIKEFTAVTSLLN